MKIRAYIICLLILLPFIGYAGLAQNPRDLTRYDDGGAFDGHQMDQKLRRFLWEHWTQKRSAQCARNRLDAILFSIMDGHRKIWFEVFVDASPAIIQCYVEKPSLADLELDQAKVCKIGR